MSRSYKSKSCGMTTAVSDKPYKITEHRRARRNQKMSIKQFLRRNDMDDFWFYDKKYGTRWGAPKDGKQFIPGIERK